MTEKTNLEPSPSRNWSIVPYHDGDEKDIVALFNHVFNLNRSLEQWNWKFKKNPYSKIFVAIARTPEGKMVGNQIVMPFLLNVMGKPQLACQALDTLCHPDFRKQGIFETTAREVFRMCSEKGFQVVVGYPNKEAYPGWMRKASWQRLFFMRHYTMRLSISSNIKKLIKVSAFAELADVAFKLFFLPKLKIRKFLLKKLSAFSGQFKTSEQVPEQYEQLWNACKSYEVLSVWKDSAYFSWRYDQNPSNRFTYCYLDCGSEISALAVLVKRGRRLSLCELIVKNRDVQLGRLLLTHIALYASSKDAQVLEFLAHDIGFYENVMQDFTARTSFNDYLCGKPLQTGPIADMFARPENWNITFGDADYV